MTPAQNSRFASVYESTDLICDYFKRLKADKITRGDALADGNRCGLVE